jgi:transposase
LHEIFDPPFFSSLNPTYWVLIHWLKRFAYGFIFTELIALKVIKIGFSMVNDPAEMENEV